MRDYELVYIVTPEVADDELDKTVEKVNQFITGHGGSIDKIDRWGRRKLAYPIKDRREGNYVLTHFKFDPKDTTELESDLRISEDVLRHLLVKLGE